MFIPIKLHIKITATKTGNNRIRVDTHIPFTLNPARFAAKLHTAIYSTSVNHTIASPGASVHTIIHQPRVHPNKNPKTQPQNAKEKKMPCANRPKPIHSAHYRKCATTEPHYSCYSLPPAEHSTKHTRERAALMCSGRTAVTFVSRLIYPHNAAAAAKELSALGERATRFQDY